MRRPVCYHTSYTATGERGAGTKQSHTHALSLPPQSAHPINCILPQILGSLPEVIRSCCHHHHHHHHHRSSRGRFEWSARFHRPSRRVAGPGKRHSARGTPRAQPRDVRSAGRDTWNLTGEALGGPQKRSWRRCSRARSGRRSAIRGAHSGALDRLEPSDPTARAPIAAAATVLVRPAQSRLWLRWPHDRRSRGGR